MTEEWHEETIRSVEGLRVGDVVVRADSDTEWPAVRRKVPVEHENSEPIVDETEELKSKIQGMIATSHDLAMPFAQSLPWNLGNAVIALAHNDLRGAYAALSAELVRRYGVDKPVKEAEVE